MALGKDRGVVEILVVLVDVEAIALHRGEPVTMVPPALVGTPNPARLVELPPDIV
jgi:hypothetical protein